jgi:stage IV sporulation protein FB
MKKTAAFSPAGSALRVELGAGFVLFCALVYFFGGAGFLAGLLAAVTMHEAGHILLMLFFGSRPVRINAGATGLSIDYSGSLTALQETLTALSGPALGLLFAVLCAGLGRRLENETLTLCAGLGFVLNAFNLLPAPPLDGGRALGLILAGALGGKAGRRISAAAGFGVSVLILLAGLAAFARGLGPAPFAAGLWLLILQREACQQTPRGIQ